MLTTRALELLQSTGDDVHRFHTIAAVAQVMKQYVQVAVLTDAEQKALDAVHQTSMPTDWNWGGSIYSRLFAAHIDFVVLRHGELTSGQVVRIVDSNSIGILGYYDHGDQVWSLHLADLSQSKALKVPASKLEAYSESPGDLDASCPGCQAKLEKRQGRHPRCICST
eukprot:7161352-Karenia_brevis.AAC.1